jgi:hypothetical protein
MTPYRVQAYNTAHDSENKIHDDAVGAAIRLHGRAGARLWTCTRT